MIVICEPVCYGHEHVPFNAGLLETICTAYPHKRVAFYGEELHLQQVRNQIGQSLSSSIFWQPIVLPPRHAKFFSRLGSDLKLITHLLNVTDKNKGNLLVLTSAIPSTIFALKFINRRIKVQLVMHGNLSSLTGWRSRNPFIQLTDLKSALTLGKTRSIQYIFLEESIKKKFLSILPFSKGNIAVLEHPITSTEQLTNEVSIEYPFRFGFLGLALEAKGFGSYLRVASEIKSSLPGQAEFHAIGWISDRKQVPNIDVLDIKPIETMLCRKAYVSGLKSLHFICFPFKEGHYELSPSGSLLDAIAYCKPLIASKLPIFKHLFDQYGDIGYLYDDQDEFCEIVKQIVQKADAKRYHSQVLNLEKLRQARHPQSLAYKYRIACLKLFLD